MMSKILSALSYVSMIGWIISYILADKENDDFVKYHLKQSLGVALMSVAIPIVSLIMPTTVLISIVTFIPMVFMFFGMFSSLKGELKPLPLIGEFCERNFDFF